MRTGSTRRRSGSRRSGRGSGSRNAAGRDRRARPGADRRAQPAARARRATESGLPGSPTHDLPVAQPAQAGLPGCTAMRQNSCSTPSASSAGLTWSSGPTETPPEVSTSPPPRAARERGARRLGVVGNALDEHHLGAELAAAAAIRSSSTRGSARRSGSPGGDELVARDHDATRGARWQRTSSTPPAAIAASASGRRRLPAGEHRPARTSSPGGRTWSPGATAPSSATVPPLDARELDRHHASAPVGQRRPGGDRHAPCPVERRRVVAGGDAAGQRQRPAGVGGAQGVAVHRRVGERRQVVRRVHVGRTTRPASALDSASARPAAARDGRAGAPAPRAGGAGGDRGRSRAYAINGRVDGGPVAPAAAHSLGPALDAACRAVAALPPKRRSPVRPGGMRTRRRDA